MRNYTPKISALATIRVAARPATIVAALWIISAAFALMPSCGASQRESTIRAAVTTVDAARESVLEYDRQELQKIAEKVGSVDERRMEGVAFRAKLQKVIMAIDTAYRAIAIAATLNDQPSLDGASKAVQLAIDAIRELKGGSK